MLSMHDDERYLFEALKAGAVAATCSSARPTRTWSTPSAPSCRGEPFLTNAAERSLVREWMADDSTGPDEPLTPREQEVLKLIAEAHTNSRSPRSCTSPRRPSSPTAPTCCASSGMRDRVELVRYAIRRGLIEP